MTHVEDGELHVSITIDYRPVTLELSLFLFCVDRASSMEELAKEMLIMADLKSKIAYEEFPVAVPLKVRSVAA